MKRALAAALALLVLAAPAPAAAQADFDAQAARDVRYCEVILYYPIPGDDANVKAYAYNTIGVDDCPPEDWQVVVDNLEAYVQQYNATGGELNGPRVFTYDGVSTPGGDANPGLYATFGPIDMEADGVFVTPLAAASADATQTYAPNEVTRTTTYTFKGGDWVYQLTDPQGDTYWMQSYSQQLYPFNTTLLQDATTMRELLTELPEGWAYDAFSIPDTQLLTANGTAYVVTDEFLNNYQRTNEPYVRAAA